MNPCDGCRAGQQGGEAKKTVFVHYADVPVITLYEALADKGLFIRRGPNASGDNLIYEWNEGHEYTVGTFPPLQPLYGRMAARVIMN
jgi:hypothetical protein